ncbi:MAG: PepSY domain-containing protein [Flavimaricola sp.]|nr:PepSY domain-containing protein [Flavimaricola sp.]
MKKFMIAALFSTAAAPVFAEPSCNPGAELKPIWESIKSFEEEGGEVISFKINGGGCYEIYGKVEGTNMEVFFDPNTGEELDRIEA